MSRLVQDTHGVWYEPPGYAALWKRFGLSRAHWLVLPRVLMHEMPDDWQLRMTVLIKEYDEYWSLPDFETVVSIKKDGKFMAIPDWIAYRHPDAETIRSFRRNPSGELTHAAELTGTPVADGGDDVCSDPRGHAYRIPDAGKESVCMFCQAVNKDWPAK